MEKQHKSAAPIMEEQHKPQSPPKSSRSRTYIALFAVYALFAFVYRSTSYLAPPTSSADPVQWHSCENDPKNPRFQCATVAVPLDYSRGFEGGTAYIALSKWVARGKIPGKPSTLMLNPGGPGGSGSTLTFRIAEPLSNLTLDRYDLIGFDPRGINQTSPRMQCFPSKQEETIFLSSLGPGPDPWGASKEDYRRMVAKADAENRVAYEMCERSSEDAGRHMSTTTVVKDIEFLSSLIAGKHEPINFYGWSYGTVIGEYLIGMFPDKIGNVVLDGVCDPVNWREVAHHMWPRSDYYDSERTLQAFFNACAEVGPSRCALARQNSTMESLEREVDLVLEQMVEVPLLVRNASGFAQGVLYSSQVRQWMFGRLYRPSTWGEFAQGLNELTQGNGTLIYEAQKITIELDAHKPGSTAMANPAVECSDALPYPDDLSTDEIVDMITSEQLYNLKHTSKHFSGLYVTPCPRWKMRDPDRFTGPINQTLSHEILIIGNTADPITSIKHARLLNDIQPMSRFIHHDGFGHCSSAMASVCTAQALRSYFTESKLPPNNLLCKTDQVLFPPSETNVSAATSGLGEEVSELLAAFVGLGEALEGYVGVRGKGAR